MDTIRLITTIAATCKWKLYHLDVKSAFLNGKLNEEIYIEQPLGFEIESDKGKVYRLHKALYGLKQAPRAWYSKIDPFLMNHDFQRSPNEVTLYVLKKTDQPPLILSLYVDDLLITGGNSTQINRLKLLLEKEFSMSDLELMSYFLGIEVKQEDDGILLCQQKYVKEVLKRFKMTHCKAVSTPMAMNEKLSLHDGVRLENPSEYRSLIGCLLYIYVTRPEIMHTVSFLSRFMQQPCQSHAIAAKRVLRYLNGTITFGLKFTRCGEIKLMGYSDAEWAGSVDDAKSTSGYVFSIGNGVFSWCSQKQETVAQSSAEAEYVSAATAANQAIWLRKILHDLGFPQATALDLFVDNKYAIVMAKKSRVPRTY
ncbi:PREDICTED: uncharacterized mitochondrial protein AtMg00810 [Theobroma cacao]|uniref:Uncharacterized mitochondrial protein AtMg00810 n=1 Tax=Theobroma cacao TaxID=3641 RepID=A0AB32UQS6_THECC|nr:PREDICTED: uncharacterized mitochondrial protein AtMg00810 [Theobroma cacao]